MTSTADPESLKRVLMDWGNGPGEAIDLAEGALTLAAINHPGLSLARYRTHLQKLVEETAARYALLLAQGEPDTALTRINALRDILVVQNGYDGDSETYDDLQNTDLIRVIDRRKGLPITLAVLYLHVARALGWVAHGLNFPGHFVVRMDGAGGERLIFDPFEKCEILQAPGLRAILKKTLGDSAELSANYYEPADNRTILVRLQNNIKIRQIEGEDYEGALRTVEAMRLFDPGEYRLLLDAGVLYARTNQLDAAAITLEAYIDRAPDDGDRHQAALLLQQIRQMMS